MAVEPEDFDNHSDRVGDSFADEIAYRCAISRKYYFIFHKFREENREHDKSRFTGYGDHSEVSDFMERLGYRDLADSFDDLRSTRNDADYELEEDIDDMALAIFKNDLDDFISKAKRENFLR